MLEKIVIGCLLVASAGALMWFKPWEAGASDLVMEAYPFGDECKYDTQFRVYVSNYSNQPLTDITYKVSVRDPNTGIPQCVQELHTDILVNPGRKKGFCTRFKSDDVCTPAVRRDAMADDIWKAEPLRARVFKE
jgi:hypothetical protein